MKDLRLAAPLLDPNGILFPNLAYVDNAGRQPQALTGIMKLVHQVYLEIVTDTQPNGVGSGLATRLMTANLQDFTSIARTGVGDLLVRMLRYQDGRKLPPDERIVDLQLLNIGQSSTGDFVLELLLTSAAGESYELKLP